MELPGTWQSVRLGDVVDIGSQQVDPASKPDQTFSYVQMEDVAPGQGRLLDVHQVLGSEIGSSKTTFNAGDVVYGRLRPYLRKVFVADRDGIAVTDLIPLRSRGGIEPGFLRDYLLSPFHSQYIGPLMAGIRMPRLRTSDLGDMPLPLPPLNEQRRIVARLQELTTRTKAARAALEAIPPLLDRFRQSVLAAAFRGDLTADWRAKNPDVEPASELLKRIRAERRRRANGKQQGGQDLGTRVVCPAQSNLPDGWTWVHIGELIDPGAPLCYGVVQPGEDHPSGPRLIRVCDLHDSTVRTDQLRSISTNVDTQYRRSRVEAGDILVSVVGTIGRVAVVPHRAAEANIARALARIRLLPGLPPHWLAGFLQSPMMQHWLSQGAREVARKTLNLGTLAEAMVPMAPLAEMKQIVYRLSSWFASTDELDQRAQACNASCTTLHQALLSKAFRGELVPQDPADEPASVLLERIRREREAAGANGQSRRGRKAKQE